MFALQHIKQEASELNARYAKNLGELESLIINYKNTRDKTLLLKIKEFQSIILLERTLLEQLFMEQGM